MEGEVVNLMDAVIQMATPMLSLIWEQAVEVAEMITGNGLMFLTVGFLIAGGILGIFGRILSRS